MLRNDYKPGGLEVWREEAILHHTRVPLHLHIAMAVAHLRI